MICLSFVLFHFIIFSLYFDVYLLFLRVFVIMFIYSKCFVLHEMYFYSACFVCCIVFIASFFILK